MLGFKSFRTKTGLEIGDGITAVVGPNGCGKSNIVDAIRWSIGSQSPKDLRGRAMEDVIFAGSEHHKPMGFAEVKLTLENDGVNIPVEWREHAEIAVCRRLFRTGESEYEINGARVRLRDVHQLFLGTGVGAKEAYSIIEQGRIGFIVSARPEERRVLIEEAAGITRYKFQRQSAQRRLDKTRDNLVRVHDVLAEVERQVASLSRQARKAARWRVLTELKRELEIRQALERQQRAADKLAASRSTLDAIKTAWESTRVAHDRAQALIEERRTELAIHEHAFNDAMESGYQARARRDLLKNNVTHQTRELEELRGRTDRLAQRKKDQAALAAQTQEDLVRTSEAHARASEQAEAIEAELLLASERLAEVRARESALMTEVDRAAQALLAARSQSVSAQARAAEGRRERAELAERIETLQHRASVSSRGLAETESTAAVCRETLEAATAAYETARGALELARDHERTALTALEEARRAERAGAAEAESANARAAALRGVIQRGEGYAPSVQQVLRAIDDGVLSGLGRPVAERLRIDSGDSGRLAGALGPALDAFVADDLAAVGRAAEWCRDNAVRAAFVWGTSVGGELADWCHAAAPVPDAVRTMLAESAGDPLDGGTERAVGWGGQLVRARPGLVTVGGGADTTANVVRLAAELDEAEERAAALNATLPALEEAVDAGERALERALTGRAEAAAHLQAADEARRGAASADRDAADAVERSRRDTADATQRLARAAARVVELDQRIGNADEEVERLGVVTTESEAKVQEHQELLPGARQAAEESGDAVAELKASEARTRERVSSLSASRDRLRRALNASGVDAEALLREERQIRERSDEIEGSLVADRRALTVSEDATTASEARLEAARKRHDAAIAAVREAEAETHVARKAFAADAEKLKEAEIGHERAKTELEHAEGVLGERFQVTVAAAREIAGERSFSADDAEELDNTNRRLSVIGAVNPAAEEEFEEAKERHDYLNGQKTDLEAAMTDLEAAIHKMDRTSRDLFAETFEAVNAGFQELFPKLFEGGRGRMEMTEPENLLETGIDIVVQPPGKRLQSMTLLSGGEKALTAVALILSIFRLKPTPFCILDEVDAPLDEANVVRFAEAVDGLSETTQFIVITHNKRTMEVANTLYGVTMEEPGVSKVVGVRMPGRASVDEDAAAQSALPDARR